MRHWVFLVSIVCIMTLISAWRQWPDGKTHVFFCDVGQGDGILITRGFSQVIIDGGSDDQILACLAEFMPFGDRQIETLIATHADSDHIGGLSSVVRRYDIKTIVTELYGSDTKMWAKFREAIQQELATGASIHQPARNETMYFMPEVSAVILNPAAPRGHLDLLSLQQTETQLSAVYAAQQREYASTNNESIALILSINQVKIAFTADIEKEVEQALVARGLLHRVDVLKVGHHGSKSSTSSQFLQILQPETAVISVGKKNRFSHPSPDVINRLQATSTQILRTDILGTIEMITDGQTYWWHAHPTRLSK